MTRVLVTGAAGMIGRKLVGHLVANPAALGVPILALHLADIVAAEMPEAPFPVSAMSGSLTDPAMIASLAALKPEVVFHLAGIVSGEAEADLAKGLAVNLDATRALFVALAETGSPKIVFTSSIAVYGGPYPDLIPDEFHAVPQNSYGGQKLMSEILLADLSRRGLVDGLSLRLPTICVRPGKPNAAASGFFSSIIREPLASKRAVLPVRRSLVHTHASPRAAVGFLIHAARLDTGLLNGQRSVVLPGVAVSVGEQIEALTRIAGEDRSALIDERPDPFIAGIVEKWPTRFAATRARDLGFVAETDFDAIIRAHIEDELGRSIPPL